MARIYHRSPINHGIDMLQVWERRSAAPRTALVAQRFRYKQQDYRSLNDAIKRRLQCKDGLAPRSDCSTTLPRN